LGINLTPNYQILVPSDFCDVKCCTATFLLDEVVKPSYVALQHGTFTRHQFLGVNIMAKTKTTQADMQDTATEAFAAGTEQFAQVQAKFMNFFNSFSDLAKGNLEAMKVSATAATKGFETLSHAATAYTKDAAAATQDGFAALRAVKTPTEFLELSQSRTKAQYDHFAAEASKMTELLVKVTGEVTQPLSNRYAVAMDQVAKAAA
jgi:phasin family protein